MNTLQTEPLPAVPLHRLVRSFRAGDHVKHAPTGEEWELACDEERGEVMPSGWPMGIAKAEHCTLIEAATDEKRMEVLTAWAKEGRGYEAERDWRTLAARRQISSANDQVLRQPVANQDEK